LGRESGTEALNELMPHLPEPLNDEALREALEVAQAIQDPEDQTAASLGLASYLPESMKSELLPEIQMIGLAPWPDVKSDLKDVLPRLGLNAPETLNASILQEALTEGRPIQDKCDRTKVLAVLALHLAGLPAAVLYPLWCETLLVLATRTRKDLLVDLSMLAPVIATLGGMCRPSQHREVK